MKRVRLILTIAGAVLLTAAPAEAQGRGRGGDSIPPGFRPPPGMCRIWLDNVPAGQQPAPTDCASAVRNRPSNGRVIFGDEPKDKGSRFRQDERKRPGDDVWERGRGADSGKGRGDDAERKREAGSEKGEKKRKPEEG